MKTEDACNLFNNQEKHLYYPRLYFFRLHPDRNAARKTCEEVTVSEQAQLEKEMARATEVANNQCISEECNIYVALPAPVAKSIGLVTENGTLSPTVEPGVEAYRMLDKRGQKCSNSTSSTGCAKRVSTKPPRSNEEDWRDKNALVQELIKYAVAYKRLTRSEQLADIERPSDCEALLLVMGIESIHEEPGSKIGYFQPVNDLQSRIKDVFGEGNRIPLTEFIKQIIETKKKYSYLPIYLPDSFIEEVLERLPIASEDKPAGNIGNKSKPGKENTVRKPTPKEIQVAWAKAILKEGEKIDIDIRLFATDVIKIMACGLGITVHKKGRDKQINPDGRKVDGFSCDNVARNIRHLFPKEKSGRKMSPSEQKAAGEARKAAVKELTALFQSEKYEHLRELLK